MKPRRLGYLFHNLEEGNYHPYLARPGILGLEETAHNLATQILGYQGWLVATPPGGQVPHLPTLLPATLRWPLLQAGSSRGGTPATWQPQVLRVRCHGDGPQGWWQEGCLPKLCRFRRGRDWSLRPFR